MPGRTIANGIKSGTNAIETRTNNDNGSSNNNSQNSSNYNTNDNNNGSYTATRTSATGNGFMNNISNNVWIWSVIAILGIAIIALVLMYSKDQTTINPYNNDNNDDE